MSRYILFKVLPVRTRKNKREGALSCPTRPTVADYRTSNRLILRGPVNGRPPLTEAEIFNVWTSRPSSSQSDGETYCKKKDAALRSAKRGVYRLMLDAKTRSRKWPKNGLGCTIRATSMCVYAAVGRVIADIDSPHRSIRAF